MTKILLTGAGGFLGRHILAELLSRESEVRVTLRSNKCEFPSHANLDLVTVDNLFTLSHNELLKVVSGVDILIHAAWYTNPKDYLESELNFECLCGSLRLVKAFCASGGRHFIGLGSFFEYDLKYGYLRPETPLRPSTLYSQTKVALASTLEQYFKSQSRTFMWMRIFSLYGVAPDSGENMPRLVPYLHAQLSKGEPAELASGTQVRDYLEVNEAAKQIVAIALNGNTGYANICSGVGISVRALAERIADIYGRRDLLRFGQSPARPGEVKFVVGEPYKIG